MSRALLALAMAVAATLALSACSQKVHQVVVRSDRLPATAPSKKLPRLSCAYQLADVVDARAAGNRAGGLGNHQLLLDDAPALVRNQLQKVGMTTADAASNSDARRVAVQIKQLYLAQNQITKVPVAVYSVQVGDAAPFVIRAQAATMNWNGTEKEAYQALADVLGDASAQLVDTLNKDCGANKAS